MVDETALTFQFLRRDHIGHVAGHIEGVVAQPTDDAGGDAERGALDAEVVVALQAVHLQHLDGGVGDVQAGAEHALVGDDDVVAKLGAEHQHLVEAIAAVDGDRRIDVVFDQIVAGTALQHLRGGGGTAALADRHAIRVGLDGAIGIGLRQREGAHHEQVVAVVALQAQRGLVAVDLEHIVAAAALRHQGRAVAPAQVTTRGGHGAEYVGRRKVGADAALRAEDLADLEVVVTGAAVQRGDGAVVVDREVVVAAQALDDQAAVEVGVVVDPLHLRRRRSGHGLLEGTVQQCDEGRRFARLRRNAGHAAQQEDVISGLAGTI